MVIDLDSKIPSRWFGTMERFEVAAGEVTLPLIIGSIPFTSMFALLFIGRCYPFQLVGKLVDQHNQFGSNFCDKNT